MLDSAQSLLCTYQLTYAAGLSSAWMLQRAMTAVRHKDSSTSVNEKLINKMLAGNFSAMKQLGEPVMKPFLQVL